ncbi:restriction endonuclease subunit S [Sulfurimonas sp. ST-25]|uniref:restriction endonuclease subunit S n=1 Tax=Sulfurimonas sp. ST-25 TaxID=3400151 RepID=UPI003A89096C
MKEFELPKGWVETPLLALLETLESGSRPKGGVQGIEEGIASLGGEHLDNNGGFKFAKIKYVPFEFAEKMKRGKIQNGDILIVKDGATTGKTSIVRESFPFEKAVVNEHVFVCRPYKVLNAKSLFYFLYSSTGNRQILEDFRGAAQGGISQKFAQIVNVPVPPLPEQHRIVEKIETLFSELDNGVESLKAAKAQLKRYRQTVLKSAFEGKLTEAWRREHADELESAESLLERIKAEREAAYEKKLDDWKEAVQAWEVNGKEGKKPAKPKKLKELSPLTYDEQSEFAMLPSNWIAVKMGLIIEEPKYGTSKKCDYETAGVGVLRIPNIANGFIDAQDLKFASFDEDEQETYGLISGDLLTIRSNGSISLVGKTALISEKDEQYLYAGYLIRLRPYSSVNSMYLHYAMSSQLLRQQIEQKAKSTSGVNNINSGELESLVLPMTSVSEQHQIVNEIESRLSEADAMEKAIDESLQKAERLRQSILKKAFEGKLVPQDVNDEPASELLKRIKKEKQ